MLEADGGTNVPTAITTRSNEEGSTDTHSINSENVLAMWYLHLTCWTPGHSIWRWYTMAQVNQEKYFATQLLSPMKTFKMTNNTDLKFLLDVSLRHHTASLLRTSNLGILLLYHFPHLEVRGLLSSFSKHLQIEQVLSGWVAPFLG
jgi:hypothetical protein